MTAKAHALPPGLPPRGLTRTQAAAFAGVSPTKFDELVRAGTFPQPVRFGRSVRWDVAAMNRAWDALSGLAGVSESDEDKWLKAIRDGAR